MEPILKKISEEPPRGAIVFLRFKPFYGRYYLWRASGDEWSSELEEHTDEEIRMLYTHYIVAEDEKDTT